MITAIIIVGYLLMGALVSYGYSVWSQVENYYIDVPEVLAVFFLWPMTLPVFVGYGVVKLIEHTPLAPQKIGEKIRHKRTQRQWEEL